MKKSKYNTILNISEKSIVLYNAFTDSFLIVRQDSKYNLDSIHKLKIDKPILFESMKKGGFIVDAQIDELQRIKVLREQIDFNRSSYQIIINPTLNCNFKCWYCYETHIKDSSMSNEVINKVKRLIDNKATEVKSLSLNFFGGEPLLEYKKVVNPLISYGKERCLSQNIGFSSSFTTNGYLIADHMMDFFKKHNVCSFQITLDGGGDDHNKTRFPYKGGDSYTRIIDNIKLIANNQIKVHLRINYTDNNIGNIHQIIRDLNELSDASKSYIYVYFQRVWQSVENNDTEHKIDNLIDEFRINNFHAGEYLFDNIRKSCYADRINSVLINYNGDVYKCTAVDFTNTDRDGFLAEDGTIVWENDSLNNRMNSKFKNSTCLSCRILPICNGVCTQKILNSSSINKCVNNYTEKDKDNIVLERFKNNIINNANWEKYKIK